MDLEANTRPTNEIQKDLTGQSSKGPTVEEDDTRQLCCSKKAYIAVTLSMVAVVSLVWSPMIIYLQRHESFFSIAWDCMPILLGVLCFWSWWRATHEVDPSREIIHARGMAICSSLQMPFVVTWLCNDVALPLWFALACSLYMTAFTYWEFMRTYLWRANGQDQGQK